MVHRLLPSDCKKKNIYIYMYFHWHFRPFPSFFDGISLSIRWTVNSKKPLFKPIYKFSQFPNATGYPSEEGNWIHRAWICFKILKHRNWSIVVMIVRVKETAVACHRFMCPTTTSTMGQKRRRRLFFYNFISCVASIIALIITNEEYKSGVQRTHSSGLLVISARYMSYFFAFLFLHFF